MNTEDSFAVVIMSKKTFVKRFRKLSKDERCYPLHCYTRLEITGLVTCTLCVYFTLVSGYSIAEEKKGITLCELVLQIQSYIC